MNTWKPISKEDLIDGISDSEWLMSDIAKNLWNFVKLKAPEKWAQHPWGDEGGGFWVVAIAGETCIYYNDIEEGYNFSEFTKWGEINDYFCNQPTLSELFESLAESRLTSNYAIKGTSA